MQIKPLLVNYKPWACGALTFQMANAEGDKAETDQWMAGHKERCWWVSKNSASCSVITGCSTISTCHLGSGWSSMFLLMAWRDCMSAALILFNPALTRWRRMRTRPTTMSVPGTWVTSSAVRPRKCWEADVTGPSLSARANHRRAPTPVL